MSLLLGSGSERDCQPGALGRRMPGDSETLPARFRPYTLFTCIPIIFCIFYFSFLHLFLLFIFQHSTHGGGEQSRTFLRLSLLLVRQRVRTMCAAETRLGKSLSSPCRSLFSSIFVFTFYFSFHRLASEGACGIIKIQLSSSTARPALLLLVRSFSLAWVPLFSSIFLTSFIPCIAHSPLLILLSAR